MKVIKGLIQGTPEWHEFRLNGIGSSDSAAILRMTKYKSPLQLWEEKTSRAFPTPVTDAMRHGIESEPIIRGDWEVFSRKMYEPRCAIHKDYNFIRASFDGMAGDKGIIEIKSSRYPKLGNCIAKNNVNHFKDLFPSYFVQVQHLMLVSEEKSCEVITLTQEGKLLSMSIPRDDDFIDNKLLPELITFWNEYVLKDNEPGLSDLDYAYIDDPDAIKLAQQWKDTNKQIKALQEQEKGLRRALIESSDDGNTIVGSTLRMTRISTQRTDYKKACEENNINLEPFKKTTIGYYRLTAL